MLVKITDMHPSAAGYARRYEWKDIVWSMKPHKSPGGNSYPVIMHDYLRMNGGTKKDVSDREGWIAAALINTGKGWPKRVVTWGVRLKFIAWEEDEKELYRD